MPMKKAHQEIEKTLRTAGMHRGMWARSATLQRAAAGDNDTGDDSGGEGLKWILTTEKPTVVFDWERWVFVEEILLADGMLVPSNNQVVLLDSHNRNSVKDVYDHVEGFAEDMAGEYPALFGSPMNGS